MINAVETNVDEVWSARRLRMRRKRGEKINFKLNEVTEVLVSGFARSQTVGLSSYRVEKHTIFNRATRTTKHI